MEMPIHKYNVGIIAAGEGSRLRKEGIIVSKPLISINEIPLIERLIKIVGCNGAKSFTCIINEESEDMHEYFQNLELEQPIKLIVQSTESSFHSFYQISKFLEPPFLLTTSDSIFSEEEFKSLLESAFNIDSDAVMAVTGYVEDEKPLYAEVDSNNNILNFNDEADENSKYVTGGIYLFKRDIRSEVEEAMENNVSRLRNFFRFLVKKKFTFSAYPFSKIIDVDHVEDIKEAEKFIKSLK